ncbi:MAG TPA: redoxin domain-containing protein [Candidatus Nitrosotalea sp.]|nr:redoxin domain-containing protein [Candidatus Nitrosotalea sp.]
MSTRSLGWAAAASMTVVLLAALGWGLLHPGNPGDGQLVGHPAPAIAVRTLQGSTVRLAQFRGRPVVLNFWASWCVACHEEDPILAQTARRLGDSVAFLGVDIQDHPASAASYLATAGQTYPAGPAIGGVPSAYAVSAPPETYFIDPNGLVVARFIGPLDQTALTRYLQLTGVGA